MMCWSRLALGMGLLSAGVIALGQRGVAIAQTIPPETAPPLSTPTPTVPAAVPPAASVEYAIVTPTPGAVLDRPATTVTLHYPLDAAVELRVNGKAADRTKIGRTETNRTIRRVTETWYGITLDQGPNVLTLHRTGEPQALASVAVQVSGLPTKIKLKTLETRVPADGRSTATLEGTLLDQNNTPSNWNAIVTLNTTAGEFTGADADPRAPGFQVEVNRGQFTALLRSATQAQSVQIKAQTGNLEAHYQFQFETPMRLTPLVAGVVDLRLGARGTNFYDSYQDFLPTDHNNDVVLEAKGAAFGTTSFGGWLLTGAFNSDRGLNETADGESRLFGNYQSSENQYPVMGDSSVSERMAPSQDHVYLRLERTSPIKNAGLDYFMWGDFNTEEFATPSQEFTATQRSLHGFKAHYNWNALQLSALYSNTVQGFQRDTIAPDGTRGYYFLSHRPVVQGSESVFIEREELNRPGTIVDTRQLTRGIDYDIDYDRGSLLFREPILRTDTAPDGTPLVRKIVATYQYDAPGHDTSIWAGRVRYHFSRQTDRESWVGGSYWREDQGNRLFELYGVDTQIALGKTGKLTAEYAHSRNVADTSGDSASGSAYRLNWQSQLNKYLTTKAYFRRADAGFANNATLSFVPGQMRYGLSVTGQVAHNTQVVFQADHEDNFGVAPQILSDLEWLLHPGSHPQPGEKQDNSLTALSVGVVQKFGNATLGLNLTHRNRIDRMTDTANGSDQLESTFTKPLTDKLSLHAKTAITLAGNDPIYTNQVQAGLDWEVHPNVTLRLNQHYFWGGQYGDRAITSLDTLAHYDLTKNTQLTGQFSLLGGLSGATGQGSTGIKHHWQIAPGLGMDVAYEYVMGQFFSKTGSGQQYEQPYGVGSGASAIGLDSGHNFSVGLSYTDNPDLQAGFQYQYRTSTGGTNSSLTADVAGKFNPALTGLIHYDQAGAANQMLGLLGDTIHLRVGLAYRDPQNDRWNALLRYEFRQNPATIPDTILLGSGTGSTDHTLAAEAIYAPDWRWEFYGKVGYRHSTSYLANDFMSSSSLLLGQLRATYRLGYRWDVMGEGRIINTLSTGSQEYGASAELGHYVTPNLRLAAGYAWGSVSDRDFNNSRSAGGPYLGVTVKLDDLFTGFRFLKKSPPTAPPAQQGNTP